MRIWLPEYIVFPRQVFITEFWKRNSRL